MYKLYINYIYIIIFIYNYNYIYIYNRNAVMERRCPQNSERFNILFYFCIYFYFIFYHSNFEILSDK